MDELLENKIIEMIANQVNKYGTCSIKQAAEIAAYLNPKLSEQKRLARRLVKEFPFTTEIKKGEIIVHRNELFINSGEAKKDLNWFHALIFLLASAFAFLLFHVLLPGLR